jgi:hypothetical protein
MNAVAWYGAIVSTLSLSLGLYLAFRDRPHLHVEGRRGYKLMIPGVELIDGYDPTTTYINITVSNRGRRPVTVSTIWLVAADNTKWLVGDSKRQGPREVAEGKAVDYQAKDEGIALKSIIAYDQTGRQWKGKLQE